MKRFVYMLAGVAMAISMYCTDAEARPKKVWQSEEQKIAEDKGRNTIRAWGVYEDFSTMNLEAFAAMNARAALAEQTAVLVSRALDHYADSKAMNSMDEASRAALQEAKEQTKSNAKEIIQGSRVMQSTRYVIDKKRNIQACYAVVEISVKDVLLTIKNTKKIQKAMNDLEKHITKNSAAEINISSAEFENAAQKSFEELKEGKLQIGSLNL